MSRARTRAPVCVRRDHIDTHWRWLRAGVCASARRFVHNCAISFRKERRSRQSVSSLCYECCGATQIQSRNAEDHSRLQFLNRNRNRKETAIISMKRLRSRGIVYLYVRVAVSVRTPCAPRHDQTSIEMPPWLSQLHGAAHVCACHLSLIHPFHEKWDFRLRSHDSPCCPHCLCCLFHCFFHSVFLSFWPSRLVSRIKTRIAASLGAFVCARV